MKPKSLRKGQVYWWQGRLSLQYVQRDGNRFLFVRRGSKLFSLATKQVSSEIKPVSLDDFKEVSCRS